jgi:hypothetical protein
VFFQRAVRSAVHAERTAFLLLRVLERLSGDINSWKKTNWLFLNLLRKQFLIWRTISPTQKREYEAEGRELLQAA